jgi:hypothetical protein
MTLSPMSLPCGRDGDDIEREGEREKERESERERRKRPSLSCMSIWGPFQIQTIAPCYMCIGRCQSTLLG